MKAIGVNWVQSQAESMYERETPLWKQFLLDFWPPAKWRRIEAYRKIVIDSRDRAFQQMKIKRGWK